MASFAKVLKTEVQRIVRREIAQLTAAMRREAAALKKAQVNSRRRIAALEKQIQSKVSAAQRGENAALAADGAPDAVRVTAKVLKSLRRRLGITQAELASLLGVSAQVVSIWENKKGRVQIRNSVVRAALNALRQQKKADVCARLGKKASTGKARRVKGAPAKAGLVTSISGAEVIKLRGRLGISQQALAFLAGVSNQVVSVWERKPEALRLRAKTARQLNDVMRMSKAEVKRRLG
jgi:DNA-binding transcriptional regulator YiaG